ncbi:MAG: SH3 domain-containing protein [Bacteroidota bacterium]
MKYILTVFAFVLSVTNLYGKSMDADSLIAVANEAYINEEYAYSAELYEQILDMDLESAKLYYNLGNAYFKDNKIGMSILNYERAKRIDPSNENIIHNLRVANSRTVDKVEPVPELFYEKWWNSLKSMQNSDNWAISGIIFLFGFFFFTSLYLLSKKLLLKKIAFYISLLLLFLNILCFVFAYKTYKIQTSDNFAIVMSIRTIVKSSPSDTSPDVFVIHEGTKFKITNKIGEWIEIKLANGNVGWIKSDATEII